MSLGSFIIVWTHGMDLCNLEDHVLQLFTILATPNNLTSVVNIFYSMSHRLGVILPRCNWEHAILRLGLGKKLCHLCSPNATYLCKTSDVNNRKKQAVVCWMSRWWMGDSCLWGFITAVRDIVCARWYLYQCSPCTADRDPGNVLQTPKFSYHQNSTSTPEASKVTDFIICCNYSKSAVYN